MVSKADLFEAIYTSANAPLSYPFQIDFLCERFKVAFENYSDYCGCEKDNRAKLMPKF
jgi:hypothetical protein